MAGRHLAVCSWAAIVAVTAAACADRAGGSKWAGGSRPLSAATASLELVGQVVFEGTCDASGAVPLDGALFAVADDENNVIRIYDADKGGPPLAGFDLTSELELSGKKHAEADLEAATRVGERAFWISSHAGNKKHHLDPDRLRFFATLLPQPTAAVALVGTPYHGLLDDLIEEPQLREFRLAKAAKRGAAAEGGLNIEGLTAMPNGSLLLGFRNPIPDDKALLVPLQEPERLLRGERARFGAPILLDLAGLGVRALSYWHGQYWIAAGRHDRGTEKRLYRWSGPGTAAEEVALPALAELNPEAFVTPEQRDAFMLLSDDGTLEVDGVACKKLENSARKRFRGAWIRP